MNLSAIYKPCDGAREPLESVEVHPLRCVEPEVDVLRCTLSMAKSVDVNLARISTDQLAVNFVGRVAHVLAGVDGKAVTTPFAFEARMTFSYRPYP